MTSSTAIGRTVSDGGHESVHGDGSVEDHFGGHCLLPHEIAEHGWVMDDDQNLKRAYLSTRASEVRPAIAIPTWSSIRNIFCWYDASSPVERFTRYMSACWPVRTFGTYLESKKD